MSTVASVAACVASPSIASSLAPERTPAEQFARAEYMIDLLRTRYVCDGWKLDEAAADRLLRFFRQAVEHPSDQESLPGYDDEWSFVMDFISSHGQSFDWLLAGDIGVMICKGASISRAARRLGRHDDPIIQAIEDHKKSLAEFEAIVSLESKLFDILPSEKRTGEIRGDEFFEGKDDDPRWVAQQKSWLRSWQALSDAAVVLINVEPTTLHGVSALLTYAHEQEASKSPLWPEDIVVEDDDEPQQWVTVLLKHAAEVIDKLTHETLSQSQLA